MCECMHDMRMHARPRGVHVHAQVHNTTLRAVAAAAAAPLDDLLRANPHLLLVRSVPVRCGAVGEACRRVQGQVIIT